MTRLVIVADDLTGAADSAALADRAGSHVRRRSTPRASGPTTRCVAVDTDSRHRDPELAAARVAEATRRARRLGARVVKKIDSTLRGHVAAELRAMSEAVDERVAAGRGPGIPGHRAYHPRRRRARRRGAADRARQRRRRGGAARSRRPASDRTCHRATGSPRSWPRRTPTGFDGRGRRRARPTRTWPPWCRPLTMQVVPVLLAGSGGLTRPLAGSSRPPRHDGAGSRGSTLVVVGSYSATSRAQRSRLVETRCHAAPAGRRSRGCGPHCTTAPWCSRPTRTRPWCARDAAKVAERIADDRRRPCSTTSAPSCSPVVRPPAPCWPAAGVSRLVVTGELEPGVVRAHVPSSISTSSPRQAPSATPTRWFAACRRTPHSVRSRKEPHEPSSRSHHDGRRRRRRPRGDRQGARRAGGLRPAAGHWWSATRQRLRRAVEITGVDLEVSPVDGPEDGGYRRGTVDVLDLDCIPDDLPFGELLRGRGGGRLPLHRDRRRAGHQPPRRRDLHGSAEQGGAAQGRSRLPGAHRAAGGAHRHRGGVDDAQRAHGCGSST